MLPALAFEPPAPHPPTHPPSSTRVPRYADIPGDYSELMSSSIFCLVVPGHGWSARMDDATLNGCLPVVIMVGAGRAAGAPRREQRRLASRALGSLRGKEHLHAHCPAYTLPGHAASWLPAPAAAHPTPQPHPRCCRTT